MAAAVWTACTKKLFQEKNWSPGASRSAPGFRCFPGFFAECFGKCGVLRVFFDGEIVVNCVVDVVIKQSLFRG
jgi:hypothetical protein